MDFQAETGITKVDHNDKLILDYIIGYTDYFIMSREQDGAGH